jgi:predicted nucleotidyltransferase component of viral defense system
VPPDVALDPLHRRLLEIGYAAGADLGLVLAGGYALQAHDLVHRKSNDIDFATAAVLPLERIADRLAAAYRAAGFDARVVEATPRMARLDVQMPDGECEVDVLKEALGPVAVLSVGPVVGFEDAVGLKVRALHNRSLHRDFIDVRAASARLSWED